MMDLFNGLSWQMIFVMVIGLMFVVSGLSNLSEYLALRKPGVLYSAEVLRSLHKELKDDKNRLVQYYWELSVRYQKGNRQIPATLNSTTQYEKGESLLVAENGDRIVAADDDKNTGITGLFLALSGACIIAAPIINKKFGMAAVSYVIAAGLLLLGAALISYWKSETVKGLTELKGTIDELILFQTDKEKRYLITPKHWYPLIGYTRPDGEKRQFLSKINSSYQSSFKVGSGVKLYWDTARSRVLERRPTIVPLIGAAACFGFAIYGVISALMM
jgi:hypothetical protein